MKKGEIVRISHWSESDENAIDCETACDCGKRANVVLGLCKEIFARKHTATHKPTSAQPLIVTTMTHTPRPTQRRSLQMLGVVVPQIGVGVFHAWLFHDRADEWVSEVFVSTDGRRACRRGVIGSTMGAYPRDTGSNPVEGNGHFFPSYRQHYLSSFSDTHTHTHAHTHTHIWKSPVEPLGLRPSGAIKFNFSCVCILLMSLIHCLMIGRSVHETGSNIIEITLSDVWASLTFSWRLITLWTLVPLSITCCRLSSSSLSRTDVCCWRSNWPSTLTTWASNASFSDVSWLTAVFRRINSSCKSS